MHKCKEEVALFMNKNKLKKPRVHLGSRFVWIFVPCKLTEGGLMKKLYGIVCHVPALDTGWDNTQWKRGGVVNTCIIQDCISSSSCCYQV